MTFTQSIHFATDRRDEVLDLMRRWSDDSISVGTAQRATLVEDRSAPGNYVMAVSFESAESATTDSDRPETGAFGQ